MKNNKRKSKKSEKRTTKKSDENIMRKKSDENKMRKGNEDSKKDKMREVKKMKPARNNRVQFFDSQDFLKKGLTVCYALEEFIRATQIQNCEKN